jgi:D-alanyl-D-alanine carboxypeptidase
VKGRAGAWSRSYGVKDLASNSPAEVGHRVHAASITKSMVAVSVLKLVEEGTVGLDDEVQAHISDFEALARAPHPVTVRQLLNHTSGIPDPREAVLNEMPLEEALKRRFSHRDVLRYAASSPWSRDGVAPFRYSDANYSALALIVEAKRGVLLGERIRQDVAVPLGLGSTAMTGEMKSTDDMIHGYVTIGGKSVDTTQPELLVNFAGGGMTSTVTDVNTFYGALLGNRLLAPATVEMMKDAGSLPYGLGIYRWNDACTGGYYYGHGAGTPGYSGISMSSSDGSRQLTLFAADPPDGFSPRKGPMGDRLVDFARQTLDGIC